MSIGIFTYSTKPRGSVVHAAALAEALQRRGAEVALYALSKAGDEFYRPVSCPLHLFEAASAPADTDALIQQRIAEFRVGIGNLAPRHRVCHAEDCLAANALVAGRLERPAACIVRTVHHVERFESRYLTACQERSVLAADLVLSVSRATSRDVSAEFGRDAPVIENGVDCARFASPDAAAIAELRTSIAAEAGDTLILSVGGVESRKNSLTALDAVGMAFASRRNLRWLIAGGASIWQHDEYRREFERRLGRLPAPLRARVTVFGTVSEAQLTTLYQASDILLCPSLQEGFGLCVLEALAARSVVVVPHGAPFDEYLDAHCASFVDVHSAADIARALVALLREPGERARLSEAGLARATRFSWDAVAERHLHHYERILKRTAPTVQPGAH